MGNKPTTRLFFQRKITPEDWLLLATYLRASRDKRQPFITSHLSMGYNEIWILIILQEN